jgi:phosphoribosylformimino-5-aminoimidazole carboxamide ribotide isomerase
MRIIPAIDLMGGKCVRLIKGEKEQVITYKQDPMQLAKQYIEGNASIIHIVDLDGAFSGKMKNLEIIKFLARKFPIQVGGGIRSQEKIAELLNADAKKVILSTMILGDQELAARIKKRFYGRLIGSFDFKDGRICYNGWTKQSSLSFQEASEGLAEIVITDTSRDGTLEGPNLELLHSLQDQCNARLISAGGISESSDLIKLEEAGIDGAIVGRALLENLIDSGDLACFGKWGRK